MHHNWIMDYGTQQVSGVSVVASVQAELDFGLLKKCIQMETERSGCTRIRFTKPDKDGNVQQYLVKQDPRDIGFKDLSGMGSLAKADELMLLLPITSDWHLLVKVLQQTERLQLLLGLW